MIECRKVNYNYHNLTIHNSYLCLQMKLFAKYLLLFGLIIGFSPSLFAQRPIWDHPFIRKFISPTPDSTRSARLLILPVFGYAQETGAEFGLTGIYNFFTDKGDTTIFTSNINSVISLTTESQINLKLESDIWTTGNLYHYIAAIRYKKYPFNYYGLGDQTLAADKIPLTQKYIQLNLEAERKITKNYYAGLNALFENFNFEEDLQDTSYDPNSVYGGFGGKYLALGISQSYDSRNSNTETTKGLYARAKYAYAPNFWGGDNFTGSIFSVDLRGFFPLHKQVTIGIQGVYETLFSKNIPFYLTNQLGNDEMMRGYYQGRYRNKNYLAGQSEIRYRLHARVGLAAFLGAGTVYSDKIDLSHLKLSGGGGLRYFFDLEHNSSIRLDYAVGEKRQGEKRQGGFYLALGQAF